MVISIQRHKEEIQHFKDEEIEILISNLKGDRYRELILIYLGTGLRRGETLALTWDDIELDKNNIKVNKSLAKVYITANTYTHVDEVAVIKAIKDGREAMKEFTKCKNG